MLGDDDPPRHLSLLQSMGLLTTGKHVFGNFCLGLLGKQLLPSSNTVSFREEETQASSSLVKKLYENVKFRRLGNLQIFSDTKPDSLLWATSNCSTLTKLEKVSGKVPTNEL